MGGIWSQQSYTDDDNDNDNGEDDIVEDSEDDIVEYSEDDISNNNTLNNNTPTTNNSPNNSNNSPTNNNTTQKHSPASEKRNKYTHNVDEPISNVSSSSNNKNNKNNNNNEDDSIGDLPVPPTLPINTSPIIKVLANNVNNSPKDDSAPPTTRQWRSNSARGLKRVDMQNVHILVCDDDAVQRTVLRKWLHDEKYKNVTICESGQEAWRHLSETDVRFDIVIADLMMPGMTGDQLLDKIKADDRFYHLPVMLMSGEDKTAKRAASVVRDGGQDFLFKPLIKALFIKKISTVLENSLIKEREAAYESLMKEKEEEIKKLTSEVSVLAAANTKVMKAIETPIEGITRTLSRILQNESLRDLPVKKDLEDIFMMIRTNRDLYAPVIKELLKQEMNPEAKSLLLSCTEPALGRRTSLPTFPDVAKDLHVNIDQDLKQWEFNVFLYSPQDLLPLIKNIFQDFGLVERFKIPVSSLENFIMSVREHYQSNPYHSFTHAFDVMQTLYCLLTTMGAAAYLTHLDIFALLISALCHDIGHPGLSNAYLINSEHEWALTYNDRSVLESHHAALTFKLLKKPESDILINISPVEKKELRSTMIVCILATDMAHHFACTAKLEQRTKTGQPFDRDSKEDRLMMMEALLKLSDISNVAKPWEVARQWAKRSSDEFFAQGALETREGRLPIPEFMDKTKTTFAKNTANFMDLFALHLYELAVALLPPAKVCLTNLCDNRLKFADMIREQEMMKESPDE